MVDGYIISVAYGVYGNVRLQRKMKKKHVNEMLLDYSVSLCLGNRINRLRVMGNHHTCLKKLPSLLRHSGNSRK